MPAIVRSYEWSRLSDSNRTILDAKELHLVPQGVERCLGKRSFDATLLKGLGQVSTPR
jgi:hypothetical protein